MRAQETTIPGVLVIELDRYEDDRGFLSVMWSTDRFARAGLVTDLSQCSVAVNRRAWTLRGMHYQSAPWEQVKIVRCSRGAIRDVVIDVRPDSPSFKRWVGMELTAGSSKALYVPKGIAHGYQTLVDDTEVTCLLPGPYQPTHERGVRWDDLAFGVVRPDPGGARTIAERDARYPDFAGGGR